MVFKRARRCSSMGCARARDGWRSLNQNDRYGRSDEARITATRFVPLNRVVMASYITLKANKIVGIYRSDEGRGREGGTTYRSNDRRTRREGL